MSSPEVLEGSGGPPRGPREIGTSSWRSRSGQNILSKVRRGRNVLPEVREGSIGPSEGPGWVRSSSLRSGWLLRRYGWGQNALSELWEGSGGPPEVQEGL